MEAEIFSQTAVNIYKTTRHHGHKITNLLKERTHLRKPETEMRLLIRPALREHGRELEWCTPREDFIKRCEQTGN
jgi:hypothetical protein